MIIGKKGEGEKTLRNIFIVLLVLGLSAYLLYNYGLTPSQKSLACAGAIGGQCKEQCAVDEWNIPVNNKCNATQVCCVSKSTVKTQADTPCANKNAGVKCSTTDPYYCNDAHECVSRCDYCNQKPNDNTVCNIKVNGNNVVFNNRYICGCTKAECTNQSKTNPPTCVMGITGGFCDPKLDVYCCDKPI